MKRVIISDGKVYIEDDRWITINADEEEDRKGQHVLIKENGDIIAGLGGNFKNLRDLGRKKQTWTRDYNCDLANKIGKEHYDALRDKVETCDNESLKKVWQKHESKVMVADAHHKGGAYCQLRSIRMDIEKDAKGTWYKPPYSVTMHESTHAIDFVLGDYEPGKGKVEFCVRYKDGLFGKTIADEVNGRISELDKEMKAVFKVHGNDAKWLIDNGYITSHDVQYAFGKQLPVKYKKDMAYQKFVRDLNKTAWDVVGKNENERFARATIDISDMVEGATKGKIGQGHGAGYWRKPFFKRKGENAALAIEAFAEMTSATATNPDSLAVIKKILPKSYKVYQEMLEEIAKQ